MPRWWMRRPRRHHAEPPSFRTPRRRQSPRSCRPRRVRRPSRRMVCWRFWACSARPFHRARSSHPRGHRPVLRARARKRVCPPQYWPMSPCPLGPRPLSRLPQQRCPKAD
ncbi:hypothetical protein FHG66_05160 [Rubellimicrobium rubrum]|uniref:Uncharacterized protein n=1 Tax=Rubellimicrobium rubrum TaxID=2585369 RepID=A0A5C4N2E7_9RHOB|nr:hypothetical protein FHG66_05160 [Rubellimicrobium rubrum]